MRNIARNPVPGATIDPELEEVSIVKIMISFHYFGKYPLEQHGDQGIVDDGGKATLRDGDKDVDMTSDLVVHAQVYDTPRRITSVSQYFEMSQDDVF